MRATNEILVDLIRPLPVWEYLDTLDLDLQQGFCLPMK